MAGNNKNSGVLECFFYLITTSLYGVAVYTDHIIFTEKRFESIGMDLHSR